MIINIQKKIGGIVIVLVMGTFFSYMPGCNMAMSLFTDTTAYAQTQDSVVMDHSSHASPTSDTMCHGIPKKTIQQRAFVTQKPATLKTTSCCLQHLRSGEDTAQRLQQKTEKPIEIRSIAVLHPAGTIGQLLFYREQSFTIQGLSPPETFSLVGSVVKKE